MLSSYLVWDLSWNLIGAHWLFNGLGEIYNTVLT